MQQQNTPKSAADSSVKFTAGMTLNEYLTKLHAEKPPDEQEGEDSDSDIEGEQLDRFQIRETDEDKEDQSQDDHDPSAEKKQLVVNYNHTERSPYYLNMRLSQIQHERPIHQITTKKNFRVTKQRLSQSPQNTFLTHKGIDLFRSLYGNHFKQSESKQRIANLHGTLYSKSIFPRIDDRAGFHKPMSMNKSNPRTDQTEVKLEEHLLSMRQLLKLRGLPTEGPPHNIDMRVDGIKDKYYERKSKSKSIKRY